MQKIGQESIAAMEKDMVSMLQSWLRIPSEKAAAEPGAPFGPALRRVLDKMLADAESLGFKTRCVDGYAGDIEMGEGEETFGILCHADIVPAGDGWDRDPFGAELDGGRVYGRGVPWVQDSVS
ncbi:MAG: hypothetical protein FWF47_05970 [Clostridia bacterium]|nr:hypothetical protein [Clostridia bacterium]